MAKLSILGPIQDFFKLFDVKKTHPASSVILKWFSGWYDLSNYKIKYLSSKIKKLLVYSNIEFSLRTVAGHSRSPLCSKGLSKQHIQNMIFEKDFLVC